MNCRIGSLYLCVLDMDRAVAFYEDFLERPAAVRDDVYSVFDVGGFRLGLFAFQKRGESHKFGSNCLPSIEVESREVLERKLESLPVVFPVTRIGRNWVAEFADSEGNHVELTAPAQAAPVLELVVGGQAQGKLAYALRRHGDVRDGDVCDGGACPLGAVPRARVLNRLHLLVRRLLDAGEDPEAFVDAFVEKNPGAVVVCDEIGCGVVPLGEDLREWRERTGRILCALARRAQRVTRVLCGIPAHIGRGGDL